MRVIGLMGFAGVGKDSVAAMLAPEHLVRVNSEWTDVRHVDADASKPEDAELGHAIQIAFADPMKEFCAEVFDWPVATLWGPSHARNSPDARYEVVAAQHQWNGDHQKPLCSRCGVILFAAATPQECRATLTARHALQQLGTDWGRACAPDVWVQYALRRAQSLCTTRISHPDTAHTFLPNWIISQTDTIVISDVRFRNEVLALHAGGAEIWQILRPSLAQKGNGSHLSETEQHTFQAEIAPLLTRTILNDGTLVDLRNRVRSALA